VTFEAGPHDENVSAPLATRSHHEMGYGPSEELTRGQEPAISPLEGSAQTSLLF
jgi:hypothetical protein